MPGKDVQVEDAGNYTPQKDVENNGRSESYSSVLVQEDVHEEDDNVKNESGCLIVNSNKDHKSSGYELGQPQAMNVDVQPNLDPPTRLSTIRKLALPVYLNVVLCQTIRALVVAALPLHILDLGGDASDVGAIASAYGFGYMMVNLPGGWLLSTLSPKAVIFISCALFMISSAVAILANWVSFTIFALGFSSFILGAGNSLSILTQQMFAGAQCAPEHRGLAMSTLGGFSRAGYAIGPFLAGILTVQFGTTSVFVAQIILTFWAVAAVAAFMPAHTSDSIGPKGNATGCQTARNVFRENGSAILRILGFILALQTLRKARELFFALAGRDIDLSADSVGHLTAISYFFDMACFPIAGRIMDSRGRKVAGVLSLITQSLGIFALSYRIVVAVFSSAILTGIGNGLSSGIVMTIGSDLSPPGNARGPFLSVFRTLVNATELISPLAIGFLARCTSLYIAELSSSVFGLLGIVWLVACVSETLPPNKRSVVCTWSCCGSPSSFQCHANSEETMPATTLGREHDDSS